MDYEELENNKQIAPAGSFPAMLEKMRPQISHALPQHMSADRMLRIALTEFRKNKKLGDCDPRTVMGSIVVLSQLGLEPGVMGQSFLVPYGKVCTAVPGWQGYVDLVSRTGRATVWTGAVYAGDEFDYAYGDRPFVTHRPSDEVDNDPANLLYVYAIGRVKGSDWPVIEVWSKTKILKHRDKYNKVGGKHYSYNNLEMYGRKIPLLQVIKYMPKSVELQNAIDLEHMSESGQGLDLDAVIEGEWTAPPFEETPADDPPDGPAPPATARKKTGTKKASKKTAKKAANKKKPATEPEPAAPELENDAPGMSYNEIFMALNKADTVERIDELLDAANGIEDTKKRESITTILKQRREDLAEPVDREPGSDDDLGLE